jgi:cytidyltransferase-like protein
MLGNILPPDELSLLIARERGAWHGLRPKFVFTSGGFDPLHPSHLDLLRDSLAHGDRLAVCVNGDGFLLRKKGYVFMPLADRLKVLAHVAGVDYVTWWDDGTQHVDGLIRLLRPDVFTRGGDRQPGNMAQCEIDACQQVGCAVAYGVGGYEKGHSSSDLVARAAGVFSGCQSPN